MQTPIISAALERVLGAARAVGVFVRDNSSRLAAAAMRVLGKLRAGSSPHSLDLLAQHAIRVKHAGMGKADLNAVIERRSEIAREVAALEAMRVEMETEDQELLVAERVLRRLSDVAARHAAGPAMAGASNEG